MPIKWIALATLTAALALATTTRTASAADLLNLSGAYTDGVFAAGTFEIPAGEYDLKFESSAPATIDLKYTDGFEDIVVQDSIVILDSLNFADHELFIPINHTYYQKLFGYREYYNLFFSPTDYWLTKRSEFVDFSAMVDQVVGGETYSLRVTSVPEPQAWLMLIGGLFGAGALLRRRTAAIA